jgi:hypothetical protein
MTVLGVACRPGTSEEIPLRDTAATATPEPAPTESFRLREPDADEYFALLPELFPQWPEQYEGTGLDWTTLRSMTWTEVDYRYPELLDPLALADLSSSDIYEAYENFLYLEFDPNHHQWHKLVVQAWFRENAVSLPDVSKIVFGDYVIDVVPYDLDLGSENEFFLRIRNAKHQYSAYVTATLADDGKCLLDDTPVPWLGPYIHYSYTSSGAVKELRFEDVNADGSPEWVVAFGGIGANHTQTGYLLILGWRDDRLVELTPEGNLGEEGSLSYLVPAGGGVGATRSDVKWEFVNLDGDPALEVLQTQDRTDGLLCNSTETRRFDWSEAADGYVHTRTSREFEQSATCQLRSAQEAMFQGDYVQAARHYESVLSFNGQGRQLSQDDLVYAKLRLAIASSFFRSPEFTSSLLSELQAQDIDSDLLRDLVDRAYAAYRHGQDPVLLCNAIVEGLSGRDVTSDDWAKIAYWSEIVDVPVPMVSVQAPAPNALRAGCDVEGLVESGLADTDFPIGISPVDQLMSSTNLPVKDHVTIDLNGDGLEEWIVWFYLLVNPVFFYPELGAEAYKISRPALRRPDENTRLDVQPLPGNSGQALVNLYVGPESESARQYWLRSLEVLPPPSECPQNPDLHGLLRVWRVDDGELVDAGRMLVCEDRPVDTFFTEGEDGSTIEAWAYYHWDDPLQPALYTWDDQEQTYVRAPAEEGGPREALEKDLSERFRRAASLSFDEDLQAKLSAAEEVIASIDPETDHPFVIGTVRYWYALLLEMAQRPDEALEQYVLIYQATPDSTWGMLANLHFEPGD